MRYSRAVDHTVYDDWLSGFLAEMGGQAGTVHVTRGDSLELRAAVNIPPPVVELTRMIPRGKGMAGLALQRRAPVQTCDLKTDETGDVRPGARAVDAKAAVALPVTDGAGDIRAVVGIAFAESRDLDDAEIAKLSAAANRLP